jgi:hypothetical protein
VHDGDDDDEMISGLKRESLLLARYALAWILVFLQKAG